MALYIQPPVSRAWQGQGATVTGTLADTALATITIPGGSMGPNGRIEIDAYWTFTNSGNNKSLRIWWNGIGGTLIGGINLTATSSYREGRFIQNTGSASSQIAMNDAFGNGGFGAATAAAVTASVNTASPVDLVLSGTLASAGESIILAAYAVKLVRVG